MGVTPVVCCHVPIDIVYTTCYTGCRVKLNYLLSTLKQMDYSVIMLITMINTEDCWLYAGYINKDGYGSFSYRPSKGKWTSTTAHKALYEHHKEIVPKDMCLDHLCQVRRCINPDHLEIVTRAENNQRKKCPHCGKALSTVES